MLMVKEISPFSSKVFPAVMSFLEAGPGVEKKNPAITV